MGIKGKKQYRESGTWSDEYIKFQHLLIELPPTNIPWRNAMIFDAFHKHEEGLDCDYNDLQMHTLDYFENNPDELRNYQAARSYVYHCHDGVFRLGDEFDVWRECVAELEAYEKRCEIKLATLVQDAVLKSLFRCSHAKLALKGQFLIALQP